MTDSISLIKATIENAEEICNLINTAYRGEKGWTKETNIVSGKRTNIEDVKSLLKNENSHLMMAIENTRIIACICVDRNENQAYIGSLAVEPTFQNSGIGKKVLNLAEEYAINKLGSKELVMVVISQRSELISFYERRGYKRTGEIEDYPVHLNVGTPVLEGLTIEYLKKNT